MYNENGKKSKPTPRLHLVELILIENIVQSHHPRQCEPSDPVQTAAAVLYRKIVLATSYDIQK